AFVRDVIDSRRNLMGLFMPLAILVLASYFLQIAVPTLPVQEYVMLACLVFLLAMVVEAIMLGRLATRLAQDKFPKEHIGTAGITTFDTADVYANTKAESVLGDALKGQRRESLEILTKVFWPTGPGGPNDRGLGRKHIMESINGSLRRLQTDYVDVYQAHRFDHFTVLEETMQAFADVVRAGKALYIGVSEWRASEIRRAHVLAQELRVPLVSNQPQYSLLWRVIEAEVVPTSEELGMGQVGWSPMAQGVLTG